MPILRDLPSTGNIKIAKKLRCEQRRLSPNLSQCLTSLLLLSRVFLGAKIHLHICNIQTARLSLCSVGYRGYMNSTTGETLFLPSALKTETTSLPRKPYHRCECLCNKCPTLDPALNLDSIGMGGDGRRTTKVTSSCQWLFWAWGLALVIV